MTGSDSLYLRYTLNDLFRNKVTNATLAVILVLSSFLMATGAMVLERTVGSVNRLFEQALPPHFLQMHTGDYDAAALTKFASAHPEIASWLTESMVGFHSASLSWQRPSTGATGSMAESLIGNLFVTQNRDFDFLIDEDGAIPTPAQGQVYVPMVYKQKFALQTGDKITIKTDAGGRTLTIKGFVRDSQMASSMSSATRILISEKDILALVAAGGGTPEIIVEYRLNDPALISDFQRAYVSDTAVPKNGQAVTYEMIRLINAFSDGLVAIALAFASLLLIAMALLNLRFVIRGTIEDEVAQIGAMKAIGLPTRAISGLYLSKYSVMTLVGCVIGGGLAIVATDLLTRSIQVNYAVAPFGPATVLVPVLALALVYAIVVVICRGVLNAVKKIQVVNALVHGSTLDDRQTARRARRQARRIRKTSLAAPGGGSINRRLAWLDLRSESGQWVLIPIVFALATVLMTLPINLLSTFESPRFVTYMGAPESDLRADLPYVDGVDAVRASLLAGMRSDTRLTDIRAFANVLYETQGAEGWETLTIEVGDYTGDTVEFLHGTSPVAGQVALSYLNAKKFDLSVGDTVTVRRSGESTSVVVSGIYQDVTMGGYTAKMKGEVTTGAASYVVYANMSKGVDPSAVAADYAERFSSTTVIPMREYVRQTLSYVTDAFRSAAVLSFVFGVGVAVLITCLFLRLRLTRDRRKMGVLSALGFSAGEIIDQVRFKALIALGVGTLVGLALAATAGEALVGAFISLAGLGIARLSFIPNPLLVYVAYPLALIGASYFGAVILTARLRGADKSSWIKG